MDRVAPDDNDRQERLAAIEQTSGSAGEVFPDGYLDRLRADWPDSERQERQAATEHPSIQEVLDESRAERLLDTETAAILSNPDLVADINAGLADAEAGRVHSHDEVEADLHERRAALSALVSDLDAIHGKPDAEEVARFARRFLIRDDDDEPGAQTHDDT